MFHYIYCIYFIIGLIEVLNAIIVQSGNDIINCFSKSNGEVILSIDSKIDVTKEIVINDSIKKLSIVGNSVDSARLFLRYPFHFNTNLEEIEIKNISINGNLFFKKNNKKIIFNSVNLNGNIDSDFDEDSNNYIEITELTYKPTNESFENCINLSGNIKINKSHFYGNSSCHNRLLHYNGFEKYQFELKESFFNGEYECPFLSIESALKADIETSFFEKGYSSSIIDGGYIKKKKKKKNYY